MNKFLVRKVNNFYNTSETAKLCRQYLQKFALQNYKLHHLAFRSITNQHYQNLKQELIHTGYTEMEHLWIPQHSTKEIEKSASWFEHDVLPRVFLSFAHCNEKHFSVMNNKNLTEEEKYSELEALGDEYVPWVYKWGDEVSHISVDMSEYLDFEERIEEMKNDLWLEMNNKRELYKTSSNDEKILIKCGTLPEIYQGVPKGAVEFVDRDIYKEIPFYLWQT